MILYKKRDQRDIKNYRPLCIMSVDYKLFTSILMKRLVIALEKVIDHHQYAFLPKRMIGDNIRTPLFLDQEKAYDSAAHDYLWEVLKKMRLPKNFIACVQALYDGASIAFSLNRHVGARVVIRCGVHQGDPLSCPLFIAAAEQLASFAAQNHRIQGAILPNGSHCKAVRYADGTAYFTRGRESMNAAGEVIGDYERGSGAY